LQFLRFQRKEPRQDYTSPCPLTTYLHNQVALENVEENHYEITEITGTIPAELEGTLFRNGPALFQVGKMTSACNPVDGDGMISRVSISKGRAFFRSAFVKTTGLAKQQAAGKMVQKGVCGTKVETTNVFEDWYKNMPLVGLLGLDFSSTDFKNTANTHTCMFPSRSKDRLLALWEGGLPHELDPETMTTKGATTLDGELDDGDAFSAHASIDHNHPDGPRLLNVGLSNSRRQSAAGSPLLLWEFDADGCLAMKHELKSKHGAWIIHDFTFTTNYMIVVQSPIKMDVLGILTGKGFQDFYYDDPEGVVWVYVVPRCPANVQRGGTNRKVTKMFRTKKAFIYHHVNAFEDASGDIVLDSMVLPGLFPLEPQKLQEWSKRAEGCSKMERWRMTMAPGADDSVRRTLMWGGASDECLMSADFMRIRDSVYGQPYRYMYGIDMTTVKADGTSCEPNARLIKFSMPGTKDLSDNSVVGMEVFALPERHYLFEPVFVPNGDRGEDSGWVIAFAVDCVTKKGQVVILDAQNFSGPPVATLHLKSHLTMSFHGFFTDKVFGCDVIAVASRL
jgi:all-trans-8'-apo-beta-carotenal 15,15'-oxygenase